MSRKRKDCVPPGRMSNYLSHSHLSSGQDATRGSPCASQGHSSTGKGACNTSPLFSADHKGPTSQASSSSSSLVKGKQMLKAPPDSAPGVSETSICLEDTRELQDSIMEFLTNDQPIPVTTLKDMLVSLRGTIHSDIIPLAQQFRYQRGG